MALDPSIPLSTSRIPQSPSIGESLLGVGRLNALAAETQSRQADTQIKQFELAHAKRQEQADQVLAGAMQRAIVTDAQGRTSYNTDALAKEILNSPYASYWPKMEGDLAESHRKIEQAKSATVDRETKEQDLAGTWGLQANALLDSGADADVVAHQLASKVALAVHEGVVPREHAVGLLAGYDPQDPESLKRVTGALVAASEKATRTAADLANKKSQDAARQSLEDERREKARAIKIGNASKQLYQAGQQGQAQYARVWNGLPADLQAQFDTPDAFDAKLTARRSLEVGMTPAQIQTRTDVEQGQRLTDEDRDEARRARERDHRETEADRKASLALSREEFDWRKTHGTDKGGEDDVFTAANKRGYDAFEKTYAAAHPKPTTNFDPDGNPTQKPPAPPSMEKWAVMTSAERQGVLRDPKARISDAEMDRRLTARQASPGMAHQITREQRVAPKYHTGQKLTNPKTGQTVTVGKVYPDGTFDPE